MPDLEKLRRFSLLLALLVVFYSLAGIRLDPNQKASVFGIPFTIENPDLVLIALVVAALYGMSRYFYYGIMLADSPHRVRCDLLYDLHAEDGHGKYHGSPFLGPSQYSTTPLSHDYAEVKNKARLVVAAFPKVGKRRVKTNIEAHTGYDPNGEPYRAYEAVIEIPLLCRLAAIAQDIDYTAPIWANVAALTLAIISISS